MPKSRFTLRKRIPENETTLKLLASREKDPGADLELREIAAQQPFVIEDDEPGAFLTVWGLSTDENPPEEVRKSLLSKFSVLTEVVFRRKADGSADDRRDSETSDLTAQKAQEPETEQEPYLQGRAGVILEQVDFEDLSKLGDDAPGALGAEVKMTPAPDRPAAGHWSTSKFGAPTLGTAADAMRLIGADWAAHGPDAAPAGRDGEGVNVVIVDHGLTRSYLERLVPGLNWGGGFVDRLLDRPEPGKFFDPRGAQPNWHGNMIARNVLRIAPKAKIYDAPLLPDRVANLDAFTDDLELLYQGIRKEVQPLGGKWVIVNAWAVADTHSEAQAGLPGSNRFSIGPQNNANKLIHKMSEDFFTVFAAGNFGEFAPVPFTGMYNQGPERSILGAAGLPRVLTVGASTVHDDWIGTSSQGDAPDTLKGIGGFPVGDATQKPDLVAPSWFAENLDPKQTNTGTSASCGVAAGVVASLISDGSDFDGISPEDLFKELRDTAFETQQGWDRRTGHGRIRFPQAVEPVPEVACS